MASFAPIRGTRNEINATPLVDGQFLIETDQGDQNKTYIDAFDSLNVLTRTMCGGGGHEILPDPKNTTTPPDEDGVVQAVNDALPNSEQIASLYGMQQWTNTMTNRIIYDDTIDEGATGIGYFPDEDEYEAFLAMSDADRLAFESAPYDGSDPTNGYGWWYDDAFKMPNLASADNIDISMLFDPYLGQEPLTLGGYILDTTNGYLCIKFAAPTGTNTHKVAVDLKVIRNRY